MRVLTYNIHGWRDVENQADVERLARIIAASQADVVALNEVFHPLEPPGRPRPALDLLAGALGMSYAFGAALMPQLAFAPLSSYGNALLSRYPILAHAGHHLTAVPGSEQRGLLEARLLLPDQRTTLSVYVTHLDHRSEAVRVEQLAALFQWTSRDRSRPHLLMGDFNALAPGDYEGRPEAIDALRSAQWTAHLVADGMQVAPRLQRRGYVDTAAATPGGAQPTFPAHEPAIRIDYIWASTPLAPAVGWCRPWQTDETAVASDHLPVLAEIDLETATD